MIDISGTRQGEKPPCAVRLKWRKVLERVGTGIVGTIGYVVLPTGVSTDVSRDIV